ncbi:MAG: Gfo/Idh/MocA family oxidoreductase [Bryobacteraceae bacterium]|nr:Gfo/Idh/MocA family oxidoreductase [Bryobacteraceae bacterium]
MVTLVAMQDSNFLSRRSAIALAGAPLFAERAFAANDRVQLGHIGVGIRGTELFNAFKKAPGCATVAACDIYDGHLTAIREATNPNLPVTRDYRELIARKDVDAVVIAVPDHWHLTMAKEALAAGKHVYLEKPMTWSIEQGIELRKAVEKSGKVLQVGSSAGSSAHALKAREAIKSGALGQVTMIRQSNNRNSPEGAWVYPIPPDASEKTIDWNRFIGPAPKRAYDPKVFFRWRCWWEYSGGVATDLFVHLLTMIHGVMDVKGPKSVVSHGGLYRWKDGRTVPDVMNSLFEYDGFLADMYVNLNNGRQGQPATIMGTEATLVFENGGPHGVRLMLYPEPEPSPIQFYASQGWPAAMREAYLKGGDGFKRSEKKPEEIKFERGSSHQEKFVEAVRTGKSLVENAFEGFASCGAAALANLSYRNGKRMSWDVESGKILES